MNLKRISYVIRNIQSACTINMIHYLEFPVLMIQAFSMLNVRVGVARSLNSFKKKN